ncbi:MAG: metallophosphoesterase [Verrucomicrobiales bacterium]|nr:metallophosphoesterase [Verrucomicrobiales bacterium]
MPLHLPPTTAVSRRQFLRGSAFVAGALCLKSTRLSLSAAEADAPERWALLSDTHIAADPAFVTRQGVNVTDHLKRVVAEVLAEKDRLDGVLIDGDCAFDDGQPGDYGQLATLLAPLREAGLPIHMTMGNHDDRVSFLAAFSDHRPDAPPVDGKHVSVVEGRHANWIFLDSLRYVNKVEGEFGKAQLAWLDQYLAAHAAKPALLIGHHYPQVFREDVIPGDQKIKISGLVDSDPFLKLLDRHACAKAYIYGHSHDWKMAVDAKGAHQVNLPPTAYVFNNARPNGWVRATVGAGGMTLELRALDPAHPEHGKPAELKWR